MSQESSVFLIDQRQFEENLFLLHSAFTEYYPKVTIGYSYKTNYIPNICKVAHQNNCWAEVVSEMEVDMALHHLTDKSNIIYNGPIKSPQSIFKVIEAGGILNIDHSLDLQHIQKIITDFKINDKIVKVALRLNFAYNGHDSRFGIELNKINDFIDAIELNSSLELVGYHIHLPFRSIDSFKFRVESLIKVLTIHGDRPLKYINIGGGFFGRLSDEFAQSLGVKSFPDFNSYGRLIGSELSEFFTQSGRKELPILFIEPGSSVVADSMWFLSKIHTIREIGNKNILVTYAARHLISPTNKNIQFPIELYQSAQSNSILDSNELLVSGYTCIESDILGKVVSKFKSANEDFIVISNVGSYSIVMGSNFILSQPPIYIYNNGELKVVRLSKTTDSILSEFI